MPLSDLNLAKEVPNVGILLVIHILSTPEKKQNFIWHILNGSLDNLEDLVFTEMGTQEGAEADFEDGHSPLLRMTKKIAPKWMLSLYKDNPNKILLEMIKELDEPWFTAHQPLFQDIYEKALQESNIRVLDNLYNLIVFANAGLGWKYIEEKIDKNNVDVRTETDLYLLWIALYKKDRFDMIVAKLNTINFEKKPHLSLAKISLYLAPSPPKELFDILGELVFYNWDNLRASITTVGRAWFGVYFKQYLSRSLYYILSEKNLTNYITLRSIEFSINDAWLKEIFEEAISHNALSELVESYERFKKGDSSVLKTYTPLDVDSAILSD